MHYKIMQLEAKTREAIAVYVTQEEVSKEIERQIVASIEPEFIEELKKNTQGIPTKPRSCSLPTWGNSTVH